MERAELWILTLVIENPYPVWVLREREVGWHYPTYHGLTNHQLVPVLQGLFQRGDLIAYDDGRDEDYEPTPEIIEAAVFAPNRIPNIIFALTPQGTARWETEFQPQWDRFIEVSSNFEQTEIISCEKLRVEQYLEERGITPELIDGGLHWDRVLPWEATYWKQLPSGHRCRFRLTEEGFENVTWLTKEGWYSLPIRIDSFLFSPQPEK